MAGDRASRLLQVVSCLTPPLCLQVLRKADMVRKNAVESVQTERNILASVRSPFVVKCFYSFTCRDNLYLVMEYLNGGDLYSLLCKFGYLEESIARRYIAELVSCEFMILVGQRLCLLVPFEVVALLEVITLLGH